MPESDENTRLANSGTCPPVVAIGPPGSNRWAMPTAAANSPPGLPRRSITRAFMPRAFSSSTASSNSCGVRSLNAPSRR